MMPGLLSGLMLVIVVIVLLVIAALAFVIGMALWTGLCTGTVFLLRPKGKRWYWLLLSIPLFVPAYLVAVVALVISGWPDKQSHFAYAFDMPVPATVQVYDSDVDGWADYEDIYLHFSATPADIGALTARGLRLDPGYAASTAGSINTPDGPITLTGREVYTGGSPNQRFGTTDEALLVYDPATGEAWYWYDGID